MYRKALVAALLLLVPLSARAQAASPDFREYQSLLDQYLVRVTGKDHAWDTRFDYEQLYVDQKIWTLHHSERLARLHAQLLSATPSAMTPADRLAWGINTYNFLIVERITAHLLIIGKKFMRYKRADDIVTYNGPFFGPDVAVVEGRGYSLDGFLRRFVYGDTSNGNGVRPALGDPRVLFATNPGCIGAPPLQPRAFHADSLDHQLDEATRASLALTRFVAARTNPPQVLVSDWLGRNLVDFGGSEGKLLAFVQKYASRSVRDDLKKARFTRVTAYMQVNPLLNQKEHAGLVMPAAPGSDQGTQ